MADAPEPAVMLVVPVVTLTEPAETVTFPRSIAVIRVPADETLPVRLPPVRLAVPLPPTVRSFRIALAVKVLPVTFDRPVTLAVPPVMFVMPAVRIEPISPSVILAVPEAPTVRLVRSAALISVPPVTFADAPEPAVMLVVASVTVTEPAETVTFDRLIAVIKAPADETLPVRLPLVRLADPLAPTVRSFRIALAVNVPPVTLARPVTFAVPPVMFVVPAVRIDPMVPAVRLAVPEAPTSREPMLTPDAKSPPVTLARLVTEPVVSVLFPPVTFSAVSVPPTRLSSPAELAVVTVPLEILAVAPD